MNEVIGKLERLIGGPRDGALLRYSLGIEHLRAGEVQSAAARFREALDRDATYSAAWKGLGKALAEGGRPEQAAAAYRQGIGVATSKGDLQAAKEMQVFARRLEKLTGAGKPAD